MQDFLCVFDVSILRSFAKKYKTEANRLMPKVKRLAFHYYFLSMIVLSSMERADLSRGWAGVSVGDGLNLHLCNDFYRTRLCFLLLYNLLLRIVHCSPSYFKKRAGTIPTDVITARAEKNFSAALMAGEFSAILMGQVRVANATLNNMAVYVIIDSASFKIGPTTEAQ